MPTPSEQFAAALNHNQHDFGVELSTRQIAMLQDYYALLLKWNPRLHLVAPCRPDEFATRHVLEGLLLLKHLPPNAMVADLGSGGGMPIIPCLIVRDDLRASLFEVSQRKCVFLKEALRAVRRGDRAVVLNRRFETEAAPKAQFVTCRALDKFDQLLPSIVAWAPRDATFLFFVSEPLKDRIEDVLPNTLVERVPHSEKRFLAIGRR